MPLSTKYIALSILSMACIAGCHATPQSAQVGDVAAADQNAQEVKPMLKKPALSGANRPGVKKLKAIVSGDPVADAEKAIVDGDVAYWGYHTRIKAVAPGIDDSQLGDAEVKFAPAMGDVIYGEDHRVLRKQFIEYAEAYNQVIQKKAGH